jgi:hypothetical protein
MGEKIAAVQELADRLARHESAVAAVPAAQRRTGELIERARAEGRGLVEQARATVGDCENEYGVSYAAAVSVGWTHAELQQMGYRAPARRRTAVDAERPASAAAEPTTTQLRSSIRRADPIGEPPAVAERPVAGDR